MEMKDTRSGFGAGLTQIGKTKKNVVALCADLTGSLKMGDFAANHPDRFFQVGVAEANMIGMAAGLTIGGKIPFTGTFANFSTCRVYDQIRQVVAYSNKNVKICASHAGLTLGEDGATHQTLEDIGLMKMLPGMVVINPCDFNQTKAATIAIADYIGPVYLRFGRPKVPNFTAENQKFEIGKALHLEEGTDVSIFATGQIADGEYTFEITILTENDQVLASDSRTFLVESPVSISLESPGGALSDTLDNVIYSTFPIIHRATGMDIPNLEGFPAFFLQNVG